MYDTLPEGIRAVPKEAKLLTNILAHMFSQREDAFRRFLTSSNQEAWREVSVLLFRSDTGNEFMDWLLDGWPESC